MLESPFLWVLGFILLVLLAIPWLVIGLGYYSLWVWRFFEDL